MNHHGSDPVLNCPVYSESVGDFTALERIALPLKRTVLFIAADTREVSAEAIARVARRYLESGLIYICARGPDCERVHDVLDEEHAGDGSSEPDFTLMSTWHDAESLESALGFFLMSAFPLDGEIETTPYLAVSVGNAAWAATIGRALSDMPAFRTRVLGD